MRSPVEPQRNIDVNEGMTICLETTHLDKNRVLFTPTTLQYRIDDLTHDREVLDWTTVSTPSSTNTITVTEAQNALFSRNQDKEKRQITVRPTDSSGDVAQDIFIYTLIRIFEREDQLI